MHQNYVVDEHGFRRVASAPATVWAWMRKHEYPGRAGFGFLKDRGKPVASYITVFFPDQRKVTNRVLDVTLRHARGGGTALRAGGIAVWERRSGRPPCSSSGGN